MSVPALIISMNALKISEQQRSDALKQRSEDQQQRSRERAEAAQLEETAFVRHFTMWELQAPNDILRGWTFRNGNAHGVVLYLQLAHAKDGSTRHMYGYFLKPCSQGTIDVPGDFDGFYDWLLLKNEDAGVGYEVSDRDGSFEQLPISMEAWAGPGVGYEPASVKYTARDITPCL